VRRSRGISERSSRACKRSVTLRPVDNHRIADRLDAFASLLELADANAYTVRAYRRAAEMIRAGAVRAGA
jgi:Helix-hairpin-helix domain